MNTDHILNKLYDLPVKIVEFRRPSYVLISEYIRASYLYGGKRVVHFRELLSFFDRYVGDIRITKTLLRIAITNRGSKDYAPYFLIVTPIIYHGKPTLGVLTEPVGYKFRLSVSQCYYTPNWRYLVKAAAYYDEDPRYFNLITFPTRGKNWILKRFQSTRSIPLPIPILDLWISYGADHLVKHFVKYVLHLISYYES